MSESIAQQKIIVPPSVLFAKLAEPFPAKDIDWRAQQCGKAKSGKFWAMVLAYMDARAVMDRLDSVIGPNNWKDEYRLLDKGVICRLSLRIDGEWITKEDGSDETATEPFKGGISSALKRAAVKWGIGRYLYNLESTFATIVDRGAPGAKRAKTKDGEIFYWVPPQLPAWALPNSLETGAKEAENASRSRQGQSPDSKRKAPAGASHNQHHGARPANSQLSFNKTTHNTRR